MTDEASKKHKGGKAVDPDKPAKSHKKSQNPSGVQKSSSDGKAKKERKEKLSRVLEASLAPPAAESIAVEPASKETQPALVIAGALVRFAIPLANEKNTKKVIKAIHKAAKQNALKRGVKEVVKALRKSPPATLSDSSFLGVVIIAGDISPEDVISHLPLLCEDHNVPYIFVSSRAELGAAAKTKRPTSVVMVLEKGDAKRDRKKVNAEAIDKNVEKGEDEDYTKAYLSLVKLVKKESIQQAFW